MGNEVTWNSRALLLSLREITIDTFCRSVSIRLFKDFFKYFVLTQLLLEIMQITNITKDYYFFILQKENRTVQTRTSINRNNVLPNTLNL